MLDHELTPEICLLKGNDVARMLNISRAFAYQLMRQGEIPTVRIGNAVRVRKDIFLSTFSIRLVCLCSRYFWGSCLIHSRLLSLHWKMVSILF